MESGKKPKVFFGGGGRDDSDFFLMPPFVSGIDQSVTSSILFVVSCIYCTVNTVSTVYTCK